MLFGLFENVYTRTKRDIRNRTYTWCICCSVNPLRLYTSENDVSRRHILTYKDDPRTERTKIFKKGRGPMT